MIQDALAVSNVIDVGLPGKCAQVPGSCLVAGMHPGQSRLAVWMEPLPLRRRHACRPWAHLRPLVLTQAGRWLCRQAGMPLTVAACLRAFQAIIRPFTPQVRVASAAALWLQALHIRPAQPGVTVLVVFLQQPEKTIVLF